MKHINILTFPCGSEVALEINRALKDISFITLWGASSVADHGKFMFKNYIEGLPLVSSENFLEEFNKVLEENQIDYVYPAMDQVIDLLSSKRDELRAELLAPANDAVYTCRNKARTYQRLAGLDFVPRVYANAREVEDFPVIIKPEEGYGSKGFQILHNREELQHAVSQMADPFVLCEYLSGEEYTIDCFTNRKGELQYVNCRNRHRIRNGISVNSKIQAPDERIREIASAICKRIPMRGAWFFQLKRNAIGQYKLLEVATRIAGTMCVQRAAGVNLPLLTVFDAMGYDVEIDSQLSDVEVDRALYNAFRLNKTITELYLDFDDTLIVHGRVNELLMRFIYQCLNQKIPITLITKHDTDILTDLEKYRIYPKIFCNIIHIDRSQRKCDVVKPDKDALFIDDSFAERRQMIQRYGILSLGVDAVECLIDYRQ